VVAGGATRAESVRAGLAAVPDDAAVIVVHDAARPLARSSLFAAVVDAVRSDGADGAIPVVPVTDTLKRVSGGTVLATVDREGMVAVQTPQAFAAATLRSAHRSAADATDDAALVERLGATVRTVMGDPHNMKLTGPADLDLAEALLTARDPMSDQPVGMRIGQGLDVHRFSDDPGRPLVLGGVVITGEGAQGLDGHSDADAVAHAIADAVLGAAGLGDLGRHAPDTDPRWQGADSLVLLSRMVTLARQFGWSPVNADCTVVAERPRLAPFLEQMAAKLGAVLGAPVNVKATTAEGLGALGRSEGIACTAVVLLASVPAGSGQGPA
jgi:2-C-methyl-D-erythritol 2,4-cyclodiphosphate synthase